MGTAVVSGLLAGYGIAIPIGAVAVFLINLGATACLCIGAAAGLGAATVDGGLALVAAAGGSGLARQVQVIASPLHWAAGAMLTVVATWMARTAIHRYRVPAATPRATLRLRTPLRAYTALAGITLLNPLTVVYWAALVLSRQSSATAFTAAQTAAFALAVVAASTSWQLVLLSGGTLIGRIAGSRRAILAVSLTSSLLIAVLAAVTLS